MRTKFTPFFIIPSTVAKWYYNWLVKQELTPDPQFFIYQNIQNFTALRNSNVFSQNQVRVSNGYFVKYRICLLQKNLFLRILLAILQTISDRMFLIWTIFSQILTLPLFCKKKENSLFYPNVPQNFEQSSSKATCFPQRGIYHYNFIAGLRPFLALFRSSWDKTVSSYK